MDEKMKEEPAEEKEEEPAEEKKEDSALSSRGSGSEFHGDCGLEQALDPEEIQTFQDLFRRP